MVNTMKSHCLISLGDITLSVFANGEQRSTKHQQRQLTHHGFSAVKFYVFQVELYGFKDPPSRRKADVASRVTCLCRTLVES